VASIADLLIGGHEAGEEYKTRSPAAGISGRGLPLSDIRISGGIYAPGALTMLHVNIFDRKQTIEGLGDFYH